MLGKSVAGSQLQLIIGPGVAEVYEELCETYHIAKQAAIDENLDSKGALTFRKVLNNIVTAIADSFIPIIAISTLNTRYISIFADAAIDDERRYVSIAEGSAAGLCDMSICMSPRITSVPTAVHEMKWIMFFINTWHD